MSLGVNNRTRRMVVEIESTCLVSWFPTPQNSPFRALYEILSLVILRFKDKENTYLSAMKKYYHSRLERILAFKRIANSPMSGDVKRKIRTIYASNFLLKRIHRLSGEMKFGKMKLFYPDFNVFAYLFSEIFLDSFYFFEAKSNSPKIIDLGANIGLATVFFKMIYPSAQITCIEASPTTFSFLKKNSSNFDDIELINKAASDEKGVVNFFSIADEVGSGQSSVYKNNKIHTKNEQVETILLSKIILEKIDLLKMDIEGGEVAVIRDLKDHGTLNLIDQVIMEFHFNSCGTSGLHFILKTLEDAGFQYSFADCSDAPTWDDSMSTMMIYAKKVNL